MPDVIYNGGSPAFNMGAANSVATLQPSQLSPGLTPSGGSVATSASTGTSTGNTTSAGTLVKNLPSWIPRSPDALTGELSDQYGKVNDAFSTGAVDKASAEQQANDLTTGLQAANSAATEYSARVRQQGGSASAAGLIRAEGQIKANDAAGQAKVDAAKYDVAQREAAAGQSAQIAQTLSSLRTSYLGSLAGVATGQTTTGNQTTDQTQTQSSENKTLEGKPNNIPSANGPGAPGGSYVQNLGGGVIPAASGQAFYGGG